jgi:hypothetical protein
MHLTNFRCKLPLDINETTVEVEEIAEANPLHHLHPSSPPTSLTNFIHTIRLRRIQSEIQQAIYRVDQEIDPPDEIIENLLEKLAKWRDLVPDDAQRQNQVGCYPNEVIRSLIADTSR